MRIETRRLVLDPLTAADAPRLAQIAGDARVAPNLLIFSSPCPVAFAEDLIARSSETASLGFRLAVRADAELIGSVGVGPAGRSGEPHVVQFFDPAHWGRGIATEAMAAFVRAVEARFDPPALRGEVFDDNPASAAVMRKLGFVEVGRYPGGSAARLDPAMLTLYRRPREARA